MSTNKSIGCPATSPATYTAVSLATLWILYNEFATTLFSSFVLTLFSDTFWVSPISLTNAWLAVTSTWSFPQTPTISNVMAPFVAPKTMTLCAISCIRPQSSTVLFFTFALARSWRGLLLLVYLHEVNHLIYGGCSFLPKPQCFTLCAAMGPTKAALSKCSLSLI